LVSALTHLGEGVGKRLEGTLLQAEELEDPITNDAHGDVSSGLKEHSLMAAPWLFVDLIDATARAFSHDQYVRAQSGPPDCVSRNFDSDEKATQTNSDVVSVPGSVFRFFPVCRSKMVAVATSPFSATHRCRLFGATPRHEMPVEVSDPAKTFCVLVSVE
jgi:hypothetical protein